MEFHVRCTTCDAINRRDTTWKGKTIPCSGCSETINVPEKIISPGLALSERYVLIERIGGGGFAHVWKARQISTDRIVAIKILRHAFEEELVGRFQKEVRLVAQLEHPLIVTAFDAGEDSGLHYLVMSYVPGRTLHDHVLEFGPLPESEARNITAQVAEAMELAWRQLGLVHRDIKPSNLMLTTDNTIRLLDLGIARANLEQSQGHSLTPTDGMIGTVSTMSPEQIQSASGVTCQSDLYALGCTLFFLLTGRFPFIGETPFMVIDQHINKKPEDPRSYSPSLSESTATLVLRLLEKDPDRRPAGWAALRAELTQDLPEQRTIQIDAVPHRKTPGQASSSPARSIWKWALFVVAGAFLLGTLSMAVVSWSSDPQEELGPALAASPSPEAFATEEGPATDLDRLNPPPSLTREAHRIVMPNLKMAPPSQWPPKISFTVTDTPERLVELPMNLVRAGRFTMGRSKAERDGYADWPDLVSRPHEVTISRPFYLATTEFTLEQWAEITQWDMPSNRLRHMPAYNLVWKECGANDYWKKRNPESPYDCDLYARLHQRFGHLVPDDYEFRIPTEAEWEYACRAGSSTIFPWGDDPRQLDAHAHWNGRATEEAGSFKPNAWGFYDMLGNVSEWVLDGYAAYPLDGSPREDPFYNRPGGLPDGQHLRMIRGGSFVSKSALECTPGHRLPLYHLRRETRVGFRIAIAPVIEGKRAE